MIFKHDVEQGERWREGREKRSWRREKWRRVRNGS